MNFTDWTFWQLMEAHSGHYLPTPENFRALISTLTNNGADLTVAEVFPCKACICVRSRCFYWFARWTHPRGKFWRWFSSLSCSRFTWNLKRRLQKGLLEMKLPLVVIMKMRLLHCWQVLVLPSALIRMPILRSPIPTVWQESRFESGDNTDEDEEYDLVLEINENSKPSENGNGNC